MAYPQQSIRGSRHTGKRETCSRLCLQSDAGICYNVEMHCFRRDERSASQVRTQEAFGKSVSSEWELTCPYRLELKERKNTAEKNIAGLSESMELSAEVITYNTVQLLAPLTKEGPSAQAKTVMHNHSLLYAG